MLPLRGSCRSMSESSAKESLIPPSSKADELRLWRRERFIELGFTPVQAGALSRSKVDIHHAGKIIKQGCTIDLAARILL